MAQRTDSMLFWTLVHATVLGLLLGGLASVWPEWVQYPGPGGAWRLAGIAAVLLASAFVGTVMGRAEIEAGKDSPRVLLFLRAGAKAGAVAGLACLLLTLIVFYVPTHGPRSLFAATAAPAAMILGAGVGAGLGLVDAWIVRRILPCRDGL